MKKILRYFSIFVLVFAVVLVLGTTQISTTNLEFADYDLAEVLEE